jgi:hypothetical protein
MADKMQVNREWATRGRVNRWPVQQIREAVLHELDALPESQLPNVLEYVRFLRLRAATDIELRERFTHAIETARKVAAEEQISEDDIGSELEKVRAKQ